MGAGKGCILVPIARILGEFDLQKAGQGGLHTKTTEPDEVFGKFTAKLSGKLFLVLDEAYWTKSNRDKSKLRGFVTEPTHSIRLMHTDPFTKRSYLRIVFLLYALACSVDSVNACKGAHQRANVYIWQPNRLTAGAA